MKRNLLKPIPPTDGAGLRDFYPNWTNSILQQMKRKFWKITDALFRILWMTNSFKYRVRRSVLSLHFSTGPSKLFKFPEIVRSPSSVGGMIVGVLKDKELFIMNRWSES